MDIKSFYTQLNGLNPKYMYGWPLVFRVFIVSMFFVLLVAAGYITLIKPALDELDIEKGKELTLKDEFKEKKRKALNLPLYKRQLVEVENSFGVLLKQLPDKTQIDSLLIDVNRAGLVNELDFILFEPEIEKSGEFYAELPIKIKVVGDYNKIGNFVNDVVKLPRIVVLSNVFIHKGSYLKTPNKESEALVLGKLVFEATAKTFRYLDDAELEKIRKEKEDVSGKTNKIKAKNKAGSKKDSKSKDGKSKE